MAPGATVDLAVSPMDYLRDPDVRSRMLEYCGATPGRGPTCAFVTGFEPDSPPLSTWDQAAHVPVGQFDTLCDRGADVSRALWDAEHLVLLFEIDYHNPDHPDESFVHPRRTFDLLEPVYRSVTSALRRWNLPTAALMTGRGYQFTSQVHLDDPVVDRLSRLAPEIPHWFDTLDRRRPEGVTLRMSERHARAAMSLGLLFEYLAQVVLRRVGLSSPIPVVVNGTVVGKDGRGRECASLDFSHCGDPLDARHMRVAFSPYQWHRFRPDIFGADVATRVPPIASLPRINQSLEDLLVAGRGLERGLRAAQEGPARLADASAGLPRLVAAYRRSSVAVFHRRFYADKAASRGRPARQRPADLPRCMAASLDRPNDLMLKPAHIQHVVRGLVARGWPAAEVAALLRTVYEAPHDWGDRWTRLDADTRADFDVRVFAGLLATGVDGLLDFNCVSAQEKSLCPPGGCPHDLRRDRDALREGRLA